MKSGKALSSMHHFPLKYKYEEKEPKHPTMGVLV